MTIERCPHDRQNPYAQINRKIFTDPDLSWEAKGLLAYFISLPDNWSIKVCHLITLYQGRGGGEKAIYAMINELINAGYCTRKQVKDERGFFGETIYHIREFKKISPQLPFRDADDAVAVKGDYNKEEVLEKNKNNKQEASPKSVVVPSFIQEIEDLSQEEKLLLCSYPEERVKLALEFNKAEKPTHSKIQQLRWHCTQDKPPIPSKKSKKNELYEKCSEYFKSRTSKTCEVKITKSVIYFIPQAGVDQTPIEIKLNDENAGRNIRNLADYYQFK